MPKPPIYVTQPTLPPLEEFVPYLEKIWENRWLTNSGPFHVQLEIALCEFLGVEHICLFNNATIALITALQALGVQGEVITTPYSFVATTHAIAWNKLTPVFVDIDEATMNLDARKIEAAITPRTSAILPVHCYGTPCDVDAIAAIAAKHSLRVVYDAAHAFGVRMGEKSALAYGDLAVLSFHATKVFNTFEGGAIVCRDEATKRRIDSLKNFGFTDETTVTDVGLNGKMNEVQAAFGLLQLRYVNRAIDARGVVDGRYREALRSIRGITCPALPRGVTPNYAYFPVLVGPEYPVSRDSLFERLRENGVHARRYFYPLLSDMGPYRELPSAGAAYLPVARRIASQVLCLPLHSGLSDDDIDRVISLIA